jgi:hypothetical protein
MAYILTKFVFFSWQLEFFIAFKLKHTKVHVMLTKFQSLKSWFVKRLKEWNTCTCQYHTKLNELKLGLNFMRATWNVHNQCVYSCENVCKSKLISVSSLRLFSYKGLVCNYLSQLGFHPFVSFLIFPN